MTEVHFDDHVEAEELGVDASEEEIGVVHIEAITYRRCVIVIVEDMKGFTGVGVASTWPWRPMDAGMSRVHARRKAIRNLHLSRERADALAIETRVPAE